MVNKLKFVAEQDGSPERMLKTKLAMLFACSDEITTAYLARVAYEKDTETTVALCLMGNVLNAEKQVEDIQAIFSTFFNTRESLDIIFLKQEQEAELKKVCKPFYFPGSHHSPLPSH